MKKKAFLLLAILSISILPSMASSLSQTETKKPIRALDPPSGVRPPDDSDSGETIP